MSRKLFRKLSIACLTLLLLPAVGFSQQKNIVETAISAGNFETLVTAVKAAGLVQTLSGHQHYTVFAPTDEAFQKLDPQILNSMLEPANKSNLAAVLTYHVLPGRVAARDAYDLNFAATLNGQRLPINFRGDQLTVGNAIVKVTDIQCSNGVIHVIDDVLLPSLDTIPAVANSAGQFETLLAAVTTAGLAETLGSKGPFTVFAPTDEAFTKLPPGTVESLLQPENRDKLVDILKYHVVSGRVYSNDALKARRAETLSGRTVGANFSAAGLSINDAKVVSANIETSNGVVHIIDSVLLPKSMTPHETMTHLSDAINRGVPAYNGGNHQECCDIYMSSLESIESTGIANADDHSMSLVKTTLNNARSTHSMSDRAWVLRRGIDSLYSRLQTMPPMEPLR